MIFYRLTPSYMFAILFLEKLQPFFGEGPLWYNMRDTSACSDYWWTNLLYINNFHPKHIMEVFNTRTSRKLTIFKIKKLIKIDFKRWKDIKIK